MQNIGGNIQLGQMRSMRSHIGVIGKWGETPQQRGIYC